MRKIKIGSFNVGHDYPCFIIAEAGVNHNGDLNIAKELVKQAKLSGADCVKFQTFKAERLITKNAPKADYQNKTTDPRESQFDMLKKIELPKEMHLELIQYCNELDILFMSTAYNVEDVDFLDELEVDAFKLASISAAEPSFVKYTAKKNKPIILSTGMATMSEIDEAVRACRDVENLDLILLQCTTNYPSKSEDSNILAMDTIKKAFEIEVGYSDHTKSDISCIAAVALGAKVIEKHFTIDKSLPGPDHSSSLTPDEFKRLVKNIRETEQCLGSRIKTPTDIEIINSIGMRRSIVVKKPIKKGITITEDFLTFKRPADGIKPSMIDYFLGKKANKNLEINDRINFSDIS